MYVKSEGCSEYSCIVSPNVSCSLVFNPLVDKLGHGTVAEVFRVTQLKAESDVLQEVDGPKRALKRFLKRDGREDYDKERRILQELAKHQHPHIVQYLCSWKDENTSYILFPLAQIDLKQFLRDAPGENVTDAFQYGLLCQVRGLCDALEFLHNGSSTLVPILNPEIEGCCRIGFHHDLKPANILLFGPAEKGLLRWKLADFGSGDLVHIPADSSDTIYNVKPSTGDPTYGAPEFATQGQVSLPKDVWSFGCILLEVLLWVSGSGGSALDDFERERMRVYGQCNMAGPTFWYQEHESSVRIHPAVVQRLLGLKKCVASSALLLPILLATKSMLTLDEKTRPKIGDVKKKLD